MKAKLELIASEIQGVSEQKQRIYTIVDLESLSASVLYTSHLPPMSAAGAFVSGNSYENVPDIPMFGNFSTQFNYLDSLEIKPIVPMVSSFGKDFGLEIGYVFDTLKLPEIDIPMRLRTDEGHKGYEKLHLNFEFYNKGKTKPFLNDHINLDWMDK
jgi:hypothetical protein